jgi:REP element-mobilizing transposase RayT
MNAWKVCENIDTYFITSSMVNWTSIFNGRDFFSIMIDSLNYCKKYKELMIYGYVIMPDHIHLLASSNANISDIMRDFKSYTSHQITELLCEKEYHYSLQIFKQAAAKYPKSDNFKVWQEGFHPIGIYSEKFFNQKLNYIHQNPVKKGFVTKPEHWYHSSARNYAGNLNRPLEIKNF